MAPRSSDSVYIAASQQTFNFSLSELLLNKKIASQKGYLTCSQLGGCESIRDIREANTLKFDALECSYVESPFAYQKLMQGISSCWDSSDFVGELKSSALPNIIFLNSHSFDSIKIMTSIIEEHNKNEYPCSLIPIIDRRGLIKNFFSMSTDHFDVSDFEDLILTSLKKSNLFGGQPFCISGGITAKSVGKLISHGIYPKYIKTGLFIFELCDFDLGLIKQKIEMLQMYESIVLEILKAISHDQYTYSNSRQHRLLLELMSVKEEVV